MSQQRIDSTTNKACPHKTTNNNNIITPGASSVSLSPSTPWLSPPVPSRRSSPHLQSHLMTHIAWYGGAQQQITHARQELSQLWLYICHSCIYRPAPASASPTAAQQVQFFVGSSRGRMCSPCSLLEYDFVNTLIENIIKLMNQFALN